MSVPSRSIDGHDIVLAVGFVSLSSGLWLVSPALALIVVGVLLMAAALVGSRTRGR